MKSEILENISVLVVEDEQDTRDFVGFVLETYGANPTLVDSVSDALGIIGTAPPDVIVTDIDMPGKNGYALIASIRKNERKEIRTIPVIALTAHGTTTDQDTGLISGFNKYLTKPFENSLLVNTIKTLHDDRKIGSAA